MGTLRRSGMLMSVFALILMLGALAVPAAPASAQLEARLTLTPNDPMQNETVLIQADGFLPGEPVTFWHTFPDFTVYEITTRNANSSGLVRFERFLDNTLPIGVQWITARGNTSGIISIAEYELVPQPGPTQHPQVTMDVTAQGDRQQGDIFVFFGSGFVGGEDVTMWLTFPDGSTTQLAVVEADRGSFSYSLRFGGLAPEGLYRLTALGLGSDRAGVIVFTLNRGDFLGAPTGTAELRACLVNDEYPDGEPCVSEGAQLENVALEGRGFTPGEVVSLWLTMPTGEVYDLFSGVAYNGDFRETINLPAVVFGTEIERRPGLPVGRHFFSAYGETSEQRAIAPFDLMPGSGLE